MVALPKAFALVSAGIGLRRGVNRRDGRSGTQPQGFVSPAAVTVTNFAAIGSCPSAASIH